MKEILLFTSVKEIDYTIQTLGELGVVDIKEIEISKGDVLARCLQEIEKTKIALAILSKQEVNTKNLSENPNKSNDPKRIIERLLKTKTIGENINKTLDYLDIQLGFFKTWGQNFNYKTLKLLASKGIYLRLYKIPKSQSNLLPSDKTIVSFPNEKDTVPVALFSTDAIDKLPFKEVEFPKMSYKDVQQLKQRKKRQFNELKLYLEKQNTNYVLLQEYKNYLEERFKAESALDGMGNINGKVKYLRGYLPKNTVNKFKKTAENNEWGFSISEPKNIDEVPVYIKNPKWISIINPMMKFIDIVPGYKEIDVSIFFLVAFALFFAMLVGDAGYGLIFLLMTVLFRKKISLQLRILMSVLSIATICWGVLSGTYFGAEQIAQLPFLKEMVIPNISSFGVDNISFMMHLSFLIGAIHLTVAHGIKVFQFINSIKALSEIGWIALIWGLFIVTEQLVLGNPAPFWYKWLFIIGASFVILFSKESNTFFKSMIASIANLPLSLISGFSDIVSYVRLFAVGMATAAVAASFNTMILSDGIAGMGILDIILAAFALLLGHTLNIALALMAVMVHGIRLNVLEFAGHLGVQFSGEAYKPFKLVANTKEK